MGTGFSSSHKVRYNQLIQWNSRWLILICIFDGWRWKVHLFDRWRLTPFRPSIHCINLYLVDNAVGFHRTYPLDSDLSGGYIVLSNVWTTGPRTRCWWRGREQFNVWIHLKVACDQRPVHRLVLKRCSFKQSWLCDQYREMYCGTVTLILYIFNTQHLMFFIAFFLLSNIKFTVSIIFLSFCTLIIGVICTESVLSAVLWEFTVFKFQALRGGLAVESFLAGYTEPSIVQFRIRLGRWIEALKTHLYGVSLDPR